MSFLPLLGCFPGLSSLVWDAVLPPPGLGCGDGALDPGEASSLLPRREDVTSGGPCGFLAHGVSGGSAGAGAPGLSEDRANLLSLKGEFILCHQLPTGHSLRAGAVAGAFLNVRLTQHDNWLLTPCFTGPCKGCKLRGSKPRFSTHCGTMGGSRNCSEPQFPNYNHDSGHIF